MNSWVGFRDKSSESGSKVAIRICEVCGARNAAVPLQHVTSYTSMFISDRRTTQRIGGTGNVCQFGPSGSHHGRGRRKTHWLRCSPEDKHQHEQHRC